MGLDWPPARRGDFSLEIGAVTMPRGCPRVEPSYERARSTEREPLVWKSRRGERVSFEGAGRKARQLWDPFCGPTNLDLDYVFAAACVRQPRCESPRRSRKAPVKGSGCNGETKTKIFDRDTPCLDFRGHLRVRRLAPRSGGPADRFAGRSARSLGRTSPPGAAPLRLLE